MARQNIDDDWKTDPRRNALSKRLGSTRLADGMRVEINWLILDHKGKPIPLKKFKFIENYEDWIECGLAEIRGEEVYISGADRYQEFFDKQNEFVKKASEAGKKSAEVRKKKYGTAQPKGGKGAKKPKVNRTEPNENRTEPNFSSSISSSISFSLKEEVNTSVEEYEIESSVIDAWFSAYDAEWLTREIKKAVAWLKANPKRKKKDYARFFTNWLNRSSVPLIDPGQSAKPLTGGYEYV